MLYEVPAEHTPMEFQLKTISKQGFAEVFSKVALYRSLNEPEEAESICHDILAVEPENQLAQRMLGLAITDQFTGQPADRYAEVERLFENLADPYERNYYKGLLYERRAKAQMRAGRPPQVLIPLFNQAMLHFKEAEKIRPADNDDSVLRWSRCARLLRQLPNVEPGPRNRVSRTMTWLQTSSSAARIAQRVSFPVSARRTQLPQAENNPQRSETPTAAIDANASPPF
jgi:tetratricopeptide (TPR) repeat protein